MAHSQSKETAVEAGPGFTPGPWTYAPWEITEGQCEVWSAEGWVLCYLSSSADARLIAAAPDFAAAAPDAADLLERYAGFIRDEVKADDLERHPYLPLIEQTAADLRAALAKASAA